MEHGGLAYTHKEIETIGEIIGQLARNPKVMCGMGADVAILARTKKFKTNDKTLKDMQAS